LRADKQQVYILGTSSDIMAKTKQTFRVGHTYSNKHNQRVATVITHVVSDSGTQLFELGQGIDGEGFATWFHDGDFVDWDYVGLSFLTKESTDLRGRPTIIADRTGGEEE